MEWFAACAGCTAALAVAFRLSGKYLSKLEWELPSRTTVVLGTLASTSWHVALVWGSGSNLWILPKAMQAVFTILLAMSDIVLVIAVFAILSRIVQAIWTITDSGPPMKETVVPLTIGRAILPVLACVAFANLVAVSFSKRERFIPHWDFGNYWTKTSELVTAASESPGKAWVEVLTSIQRDDYNQIPSILPAFVVAAFGDYWTVFRHAIVTIYGTTVAFATVWTIRRTYGQSSNMWAEWWPVALVATFPILWAPTLMGYVDLGGVALSLCVFGLYLKAPARELSARTAIALGIAFAAIFLFRRWFSIWMVSFVVVATVEAVARTAWAIWRR